MARVASMSTSRHQTQANERSNQEQDCKFIDDYQALCREFDQLAMDLFRGEEMDKLTGDFLDRHRFYLAQFVLEFAPGVKQLLSSSSPKPRNPTDLSKLNENLNDDLKLMHWLSDERAQKQDASRASSLNVILSDLYRRIGQASYLRITFNSSRLKRDEDRREPVGWLQLAIRHDTNNFEAWHWFMIVSGYYSDNLTNPRDRVLAGETFRLAILRCLQMEPNDALAHHLLGRYYYNVAGLSWIQRTMAKGVLNVKLEGSYEEAEREFLQAHSIKANWLPSYLWMARVLLAQNKSKQDVRHWIEQALEMEVCEPTSEIERNELLELGRKLKLIQ